MPVPLSLEVFLDGYLLAYVLSLVDLAEASLADQLQFLNVLFLDQKLEGPVLLQKLIELPDLTILVRFGLSFLPGQLHNRINGRR